MLRRHKHVLAMSALSLAAALTALLAEDAVFRTGIAPVRVDTQVSGAAGGVNGLTKEDFAPLREVFFR